MSESDRKNDAKIQELEDQHGLPTAQEQQQLVSLVKQTLNPDGNDPRIDEYITSTFSYISGMLYKMATAENKEHAAQEVAQDLNDKFEKWVESREKDEAEAQDKDSKEEN